MSDSAIALIPTTGEYRDWTPQQAALMEFAGLVKKITTANGAVWQNAPRPVIEAFAAACHRTQLDPIARQIWCIERDGKYTISVSIDGLRLVAQRSHEYQGATASEWTADGINWLPVWVDHATPPAAARVGIRRAGFVEPMFGVAPYEEFVQRKRNGDVTSMWAGKPAHMLAKVAEALALRRAFPMELSGLYTDDEIAPDAVVYEASRDWLALIKATDDKADLAKLYAELRDTGEWTENLAAEIMAHSATLTKDSRPAQIGAPGHTGDPEVDAPATVAPVEDMPPTEPERDPAYPTEEEIAAIEAEAAQS